MELTLPLFLILILAIPLLWFFLNKKHSKKNGESLHPPGPPGLPLVGDLHQLDFTTLHSHLWELSKKYGPLMSLQLGSLTVLVVSSAETAKEALKTHDLEFASRPLSYGPKRVTRNGLDVTFSPYGEYWREIRKLNVLHLLSAKRVQSFRPVRENEVSRMIKIVSTLAYQSRPVNLSEITLSLTSSIICRIAFGKRYDGQGSTKSEFQDLLHDVQAVVGGFFLCDYFPYVGWVDKLMGKSAWVDKVYEDLDLFLQGIIDDHIDRNNNSKLKGDHDHHQEDITDVLLQLQKDDSFSVHLTLDHIKCQLLDIFSAGTDTSSAAVVWAMSELMKNPRAMTKVQQEVRSYKKNINGHDDDHDHHGCFIHESDLDQLVYLKAVVKEALRLHPPAPLAVPHLATQMCKIHGYEVHPGTVVYINLWAIGRDPDYWEKPEEFRPERFLESSDCIDFKGKDFGFIPFGAGRRGCPGINLGAVNVELALANLVCGFNWELPVGMRKEDIDSDVRPGVTMHKKNDLILLAKK